MKPKAVPLREAAAKVNCGGGRPGKDVLTALAEG
jgi:hypothetical protein